MIDFIVNAIIILLVGTPCAIVVNEAIHNDWEK